MIMTVERVEGAQLAAADRPSDDRTQDAAQAARSAEPAPAAPLTIVRDEAAEPPDLGSVPPDRAPLTVSPALWHLQTALGVAKLRAQDLLAKANLGFKQAPNPVEHLQAAHRANAERQVRNSVDLRVMTYNVALLDLRATLGNLIPPLKWLGKIPILGWPFKWLADITLKHVISPKLEARRDKLPQLIFSKGDDVVMLQEVWRPQDVPWFTEQAKRYGYVAIASPRDDYNDGLMTFVKATAIDAREGLHIEARAYDKQVWTESLAGVKRGYHQVSFTHPTLGPVHVLNTHMQAYPDAWENRMHQSREVGLAARRLTEACPSDIVILGGDLNSGPYYKQDVWRGGKEPVKDWWRNSVAYGMLEHYSGLADAGVLGQPAEEIDADSRLSGQSTQTPRWPHTADASSNGLYEEQYHQEEPPARLDHIRVNATNPRVRVASSQMAFTDEIETAAGRIEPSDHYGVRVHLQVARSPRTPDAAEFQLPR